MGLFSRKGPSGFSSSSTAEEVTQGIDGTGLTAIVTGATSGIGLETSRVLALRGVHVVIAIRNMNAAEYGSTGFPLNILMGYNTIQAFSRQHRTPFRNESLRSFSSHKSFVGDHETHIARKQQRGKIVNLSSTCHQYSYREGIRFDKINEESSYCKYLAYGQSKLANILHANELTRRLKEEGVQITANSLHPGAIQTNILRFDNGILHYIVKVLGVFIIPFIKTIQQGAATTCFVALHPQVKGVSGEYFADCNIDKPSAQAKDEDLATKLWDFSLALTNVK
ncbi:hypothetical protein M0R45_024372 [Rubus argutus]|uniref:Short-chain dehydrogenase TIC 32, chloroplastic n=1 Tax=Rubus argutus TaxID=59490 RepID=A0AAW1WRC8_RUBAR